VIGLGLKGVRPEKVDRQALPAHPQRWYESTFSVCRVPVNREYGRKEAGGKGTVVLHRA